MGLDDFSSPAQAGSIRLLGLAGDRLTWTGALVGAHHLSGVV